MALACAVTAETTTPKAGQRVPCRVTVTNDTANPARITGIQVYPSTLNVACHITQPEFGAGGSAGLDASDAVRIVVVNQTTGSLSFPFDFVGYQPQVPASSAVTYTLNAVVTFSDNSTVSNTLAINVSPVSAT